MSESTKFPELADLKGSAGDSGKISRALLFSFYLTLAYIGITILSIEDFQLFFPEEQIELPVLKVKIDLFPFFLATPAILIIYHYFLLFSLYNHREKFTWWIHKAHEEEGGESNTVLKNYIYGIHPFFLDYLDHYDFHLDRLKKLNKEGRKKSVRPVWIRKLSIRIFKFFNVLVIYIIPFSALLLISWKFMPYQDWVRSAGLFGMMVIDWVLLTYFAGRITFPYNVREKEPFVSFKTQRNYIKKSIFTIMLIMGLGVFLGTFLKQSPSWSNNFLKINGFELGITNPESIDHYQTKTEIKYAQNDILDRSLRNIKIRNSFLIGVDFGKSDLYDAQIENTMLPFCQFDGVDLTKLDMVEGSMIGMEMETGSLTEARFFKTNLRGAIIEKVNALELAFSDCKMEGASLVADTLWGVDFAGSELSGTDFNGSYMAGANFFGCELIGANFEGCDLRGANFTNADLRFANLRDAQLQGANFTGADLQHTNLESADVFGAIFFECYYNQYTNNSVNGANQAWWAEWVEQKDPVRISTAEWDPLMPNVDFGQEKNPRNPRVDFWNLLKENSDSTRFLGLADTLDMDAFVASRSRLICNLFSEGVDEGKTFYQEVNPMLKAVNFVSNPGLTNQPPIIKFQEQASQEIENNCPELNSLLMK